MFGNLGSSVVKITNSKEKSVLNRFKHMLGLNVLNVHILQQHAKYLSGSLSETASEVPNHSYLPISDIAKAVTLDALRWRTQQQPHALLDAYMATFTQDELRRFTSFTSALQQDVERLGVPGWMPKHLGAAIEECIFARASTEEDRLHQSFVAHFMARQCIEKFVKLIRWRLPKG